MKKYAVYLLIVASCLFCSIVLAQDTGVRDTCRFVPETATWTINTEADTLFTVAIWGWSDQVIKGLSLPYIMTTDTGGGTGHDDSLIVAKDWVHALSPMIPSFAYSHIDGASFPAALHNDYNGILIGMVNLSSPLFPAGTPSKFGDLTITMLDAANASSAFDIVIDSLFFPPAGAFKFSPDGGTGFPPVFIGATISVNNTLGQPPYDGPVWYASDAGSDEIGDGTYGNPFRSIQKCVDLAVDGDTVIIFDGSYYQEIDFNGKKIIVSSFYVFDGNESHIAATRIQGSGPSDTIVSFVSSEDSLSKLMGLTLKWGTVGIESMGASPHIYKCDIIYCDNYSLLCSYGGSPKFTACHLADEIMCGDGGHPIFDSCTIDGHITVRYGGGGCDLINSTAASMSRVGGSFNILHSVVNGGISNWTFGNTLIRHSIVNGVVSSTDDGFTTVDSSIVSNLTSSSDYGYITASNTLVTDPDVSVKIWSPAYLSATNCTFLGKLDVSDELHLNKCIIAVDSDTAVYVSTWADIHLDSVDVWGDTVGTWLSGIPIELDTNVVFSENPKFCDPAGGNYHIDETSPCAPGNQYCGFLVGAYDVSCYPPQITSPDTDTAYVLTTYTHVVTFNEPDGETGAISFYDYPDWLSPASDRILGVPSQGDVGETTFKVVVLAGPSADTLVVRLTVRESNPKLCVSSNLFEFQAVRESTDPSSQTLQVYNCGTAGALPWTTSGINSTWLLVTPRSGSAPTNVSVGVDISGLPVGVYTDTFTVLSDPATWGTEDVAVKLTVTNELDSIVLSPQDTTIPLGTTATYSAVGYYRDGTQQDVTAAIESWNSSSQTVATISASVASGIGIGTTTITATLSGKTDDATLEVSEAALVSITVSADANELPVGQTLQCSASGMYTDESVMPIEQPDSWSSSSLITATIDANGLVTALAEGNTTISAHVGDSVGTFSLNVIPPALDSIVVSPDSVDLPIGMSQKYSASGFFSNDSSATIESIDLWTSSDTAIADIDNSTGLASAKQIGRTSIIGEYQEMIDSAIMVVVEAVIDSIFVIPDSVSVAVGETADLECYGHYTDGDSTAIDTAIWESDDESIAFVDQNGVVSGLDAGDADIRATIDRDKPDSLSGNSSIHVHPPRLLSLWLDPSDTILVQGDTIEYRFVDVYTDGDSLRLSSTDLVWESGDESVAGVIGTGVIELKDTGTVEITVSDTVAIRGESHPVSGAALIISVPLELQSIVVTPDSVSIPKDSSTFFGAIGFFNNGKSWVITDSVIWESTDPNVAPIVNQSQGEILARNVGIAEIMAYVDDCPDTASAKIVVIPALVGISGDVTGATIGSAISLYVGVKELPDSAHLYYRRGGETEFAQMDLTFTGLQGSGQVPGAEVGIRGVEYYFNVIDEDLGATEPPGAPYDSLFIIRTSITNTDGAISIVGNRYHIIGFPFEVDPEDFDSVFVDDLGQPNSTIWRLGRWNGSGYDEYSDVGDIAGGLGYWLLTAADETIGAAGQSAIPDTTVYDTIQYDPTVIVESTRYAELVLDPGYNQISTPFAFNINWNDRFEKHPDLISDSLWNYTPGVNDDYTMSSKMEPFAGYWVLNESSVQQLLLLPYIEASQQQNQNVMPFTVSENNWKVELSLTSSGRVMSTVVVGCLLDASDGYDSYDYVKPPAIGKDVSLRSLGTGMDFQTERLSGDFRGQTDSCWVYQIEVRGSLVGEAAIKLIDDDYIPAKFSIVLGSEDQGWQCDLKEACTCVLPLPVDDQGAVYQLHISKGTSPSESDDGSQQMPADYYLWQNYPNPFNAATEIKFGIPADTHVRVRIYDIIGRRIATLIDGIKAAGVHAANWDGRDASGKAVSSGIYFYHIQADGYSQCKKMLLIK